MVQATPARQGRRYREHGRSYRDVELTAPDGASVIITVNESNPTQSRITDSRLGHEECCPDPEETIAILKSRGYVEYVGFES